MLKYFFPIFLFVGMAYCYDSQEGWISKLEVQADGDVVFKVDDVNDNSIWYYLNAKNATESKPSLAFLYMLYNSGEENILFYYDGTDQRETGYSGNNGSANDPWCRNLIAIQINQ